MPLTEKELLERHRGRVARRTARATAVHRDATRKKPARDLKGRRASLAKRTKLLELRTVHGVEAVKALMDPPKDSERPSLMRRVREYQKAARAERDAKRERRLKAGDPPRLAVVERQAVGTRAEHAHGIEGKPRVAGGPGRAKIRSIVRSDVRSPIVKLAQSRRPR